MGLQCPCRIRQSEASANRVNQAKKPPAKSTALAHHKSGKRRQKVVVTRQKVTVTQKWSLHGKKVVKSGNLRQNAQYIFSTFTRHFEEILECYNNKFHRLRILVNQKWGSKSHNHFTNLQTMCKTSVRIWDCFYHNCFGIRHQQNSKSTELFH